MINFTVEGQPQGKGRARVTVRNGHARAYTPEKTASYENYIKLSAVEAKEKQGNIFFDKVPLKAIIKAFYGIPASWSNKKSRQAELGEIKPTIKPDGDNIAKTVLDALNGILYTDDSQITRLTVSKIYSKQPRVEVEIMEDKE